MTTNGLVVLLAWVEFVLLVVSLAYWVLRAQNRDALAEAEGGAAGDPSRRLQEDVVRQRQIEAALTSGALTHRFPSPGRGNESRVDRLSRGEDSSDGAEGT